MKKNLPIIIALFILVYSGLTNAQTLTINTIAGNGIGGYSGDAGAATSAELYNPFDIAYDNLGNIYISDQSNNRIRKITPGGIISTIAGTGVAGFSGDGGAATAAKIHTPLGIVIDGSGNIYFMDYDNGRVRKINTNGIISTVAGNGGVGSSGDGGAATSASFYYASGIAIDNSGNIYIVSVHRVRLFT